MTRMMVRNRLEISPPPPLFAPEPSPFTFYLLPFTFYLFPFSFFLFPFTYYPLPFILYPLCLMPYALCLVPCALCFINLYALCLVLPPGPSYLILRLPFFVPYPLPFYLPQSSLTPASCPRYPSSSDPCPSPLAYRLSPVVSRSLSISIDRSALPAACAGLSSVVPLTRYRKTRRPSPETATRRFPPLSLPRPRSPPRRERLGRDTQVRVPCLPCKERLPPVP